MNIRHQFLPEGLSEELLGAYIEGKLGEAEELAVEELLDGWDESLEVITSLTDSMIEGMPDDVPDFDVDAVELPPIAGLDPEIYDVVEELPDDEPAMAEMFDEWAARSSDDDDIEYDPGDCGPDVAHTDIDADDNFDEFIPEDIE